MASTDPTCPYCEAEIPLYGGDQSGDEVYCSFCNCPSILKKIDQFQFICLEPDAPAEKKKFKMEEGDPGDMR